MKEGKGLCNYKDGDVYEGMWKENKEHGEGTPMLSISYIRPWTLMN
jgi:hypothetical protein